MALEMRINFVDVICDGSLKNTYAGGRATGYEFDIRLSNYRGHFLSCIDRFGVSVDGEDESAERVTFGINGKDFYVEQLGQLSSEFWELLEPAHIRVWRPGGLAPGEHDVHVMLYLRVPYLPLPGGEGDHNYVPLNASGDKRLPVQCVGGGE